MNQSAKRATFFSFHYADIMRVNVVRRSGEFKTPESSSGRQIEGFYDRSLWETSKRQGAESLKSLIRTGMKNTSVVCVLAGSETFSRPWVRYEIARSVIDEKGLFTVHINSIKDISPPHMPKDRGPNPNFYMGIARHKNGNFYLCERKSENGQWTWKWYSEYTDPVKVPRYMPEPAQGHPIRLSEYTLEYDWSLNGHANIGGWLDLAAQDAGR